MRENLTGAVISALCPVHNKAKTNLEAIYLNMV